MSNNNQTNEAECLVRVVPEIIAVPSNLPGGLDAELGTHFGKSECFTVVTYKGDDPVEIKVVPNGPHSSCGGVIELLATHNVQAIAACHIGMRPLQACFQAGITPYAVEVETVGAACKQLRDGKLRELAENDSCQSTGAHGHGHGHG